MRCADIQRMTKETKISLTLNLDGTGKANLSSGSGFLDHMLTLFAVYGCFDLTINCQGDTYVDDHHTVEDIGICLGLAFEKALSDKAGIARYGQAILPMDEALILAAIDISGRSYLGYDVPFETEKIGAFDTQLVEEFWQAFARTSGMTIHIRRLAGHNSHHVAEGVFKAMARCLRMACAVDPRQEGVIPSSKGLI
ncbi:MAG: imidazoleglycerol-phosphate dehydratase HisB [Clostridia bacterium]|nr:imidazoleglycerol-phosphate dehydratase HisB [Clostridia bacterium]